VKPLASTNQPRETSRLGTGILLGFCAIFIFYETAIPFHFDLTRAGLLYRWECSEWIPFLDNDGSWLSLADAIGNVLLFVPFGFFLHSWRLARHSSVDSVNLRLTLQAALLYSATIEIIQLFLDRRTTSVNDLITNFTGAYLGIKLARAHSSSIGVAWNEIRRISRARPVLVLWVTTMLAQTLLALAPFDFTLQQENFQRQLLRLQYSWRALLSLDPMAPNWKEFLQRFPHHENILASSIVTGGCGILLGASWIFCRREYGPTSSRIVRRSTWMTFGFYPAVTLLQFMVQSNRPNVIFPASGLCSVVAGALIMTFLLRLTVISLARRKNRDEF